MLRGLRRSQMHAHLGATQGLADRKADLFNEFRAESDPDLFQDHSLPTAVKLVKDRRLQNQNVEHASGKPSRTRVLGKKLANNFAPGCQHLLFPQPSLETKFRGKLRDDFFYADDAIEFGSGFGESSPFR